MHAQLHRKVVKKLILLICLHRKVVKKLNNIIKFN
jgi:hypothetical protein